MSTMSSGLFPNNSMTLEQKKEMVLKASEDGGWLQIKQEIAKFDAMHNSLVTDMENQHHPLFRLYLTMFKAKLGPEEFLKNSVQIYATCNQRCSLHPVGHLGDEMMQDTYLGGLEPPPAGAVSTNENVER